MAKQMRSLRLMLENIEYVPFRGKGEHKFCPECTTVKGDGHGINCQLDAWIGIARDRGETYYFETAAQHPYVEQLVEAARKMWAEYGHLEYDGESAVDQAWRDMQDALAPFQELERE